MKLVIFLLTVFSTTFLQTQVSAPAPIILAVDVITGPQVQYWGWDTKGSANLASTFGKANALYADTGANIIRIPIFAYAHMADGSTDSSQYSEVITDVKNALKANPDVKVFASIKLKGADTFPAWVDSGEMAKIFAKNAKKIDPDKYSDLLSGYITFMQQQGVKIDFLGINNEVEGAVPAVEYAATVRALKAKLAKSSIPVEYRAFKFVGPETYEIGTAVSYATTLVNNEAADTVDIAASHYYYTGSNANPSRVDWEHLASKIKLPMWFTEAHIALNDKPIIVTDIRRGLALIFSANKGGASGFVWWNAGDNDKNMDFAVKHEIVRTMMGGHPIQTLPDFNEQDSHTDASLYQAYRKDNTVHLWIINPGAVMENKSVKLQDATLLSVSSSLYWNGPGDELIAQNTGKLAITIADDKKSFTVAKIPANSVDEITFELPVAKP